MWKRGKIKVLQKFGKADKTVDEEFEDLRIMLESKAKLVKQTLEDLRNYRELRKKMSAAAVRMAETMQLWYADYDEHYLQEGMSELVDYMRKEDTSNVSVYHGYTRDKCFEEMVIDPIFNYNAGFSAFKSKVQERGRLRLDYDASQRTLINNQDKIKIGKGAPAKVPVQEADVERKKTMYENANSSLITDLPHFMDSMTTVMEKPYKNFIEQEIAYHKSALKELENFQKYCNTSALDSLTSSVSSSLSSAAAKAKGLVDSKISSIPAVSEEPSAADFAEE
eukprot:GCRY01000915.1.p1 GENE.GCRY01000915.1~~GCRY01000915.1.p1  ORF type:complete len:280 (+),score=49.13 GCRY01000915.1:92-931(+)